MKGLKFEVPIMFNKVVLPTTANESFETFGLVSFTTPAQVEGGQVVPMWIALEVDFSGSMRSAKNLLVSAVLKAVSLMKSTDKLCLVLFNQHSEVVYVDDDAINPNRLKDVEESLMGLTPRGGTYCVSGYRAVMNFFERAPSNVVRRIGFLTDGVIGDLPQAVPLVTDMATKGITTFAFGLGQDYNPRNTNLLAEAGKTAVTMYIKQPIDLEKAFTNFIVEAQSSSLVNPAIGFKFPDKGICIKDVAQASERLQPLETVTHDQSTIVRLGDLEASTEYKYLVKYSISGGRKLGPFRIAKVAIISATGATDELPVVLTFVNDPSQQMASVDLNISKVLQRYKNRATVRKELAAAELEHRSPIITSKQIEMIRDEGDENLAITLGKVSSGQEEDIRELDVRLSLPKQRS